MVEPAQTQSAPEMEQSGNAFTVTVALDEVLVLKLESPLYWAVIECEPAVSDVVEKLACPEASSVSVSITVAPSIKATVPVGVPRSAGLLVTTAVRVTGWPKQNVSAEVVNAVMVSVV